MQATTDSNAPPIASPSMPRRPKKEKKARAPRPPRSPEEQRARDEKALARAEARALRLKNKLSGKLTHEQLVKRAKIVARLLGEMVPSIGGSGDRKVLMGARDLCGLIATSVEPQVDPKPVIDVLRGVEPGRRDRVADLCGHPMDVTDSHLGGDPNYRAD